MRQYLILGIGAFGSSVLDRVRALPIERNIVYHNLDCAPEAPLARSYVTVRQELLDVLNKKVHNFANTQLTVYLVGLFVEEHMADNLMHLGYLFKSFFRENIILNPRIKVVTALPTIIPEHAYAWLPATRATLDRLDGLAALKEQFKPDYPDVKRALPAISGPPWEDIVFCYSESLDEEDVAVTAQAAATKIYFDLVLLPKRQEAQPGILEFYRSFPAGQAFLPIAGTAVAFLPALSKLIRDEMEYVLLMRLCERFFPVEPPEPAKLDKKVEAVLRKARVTRPRDVADEIVGSVLEHERWFDLAALDALARYDIEMSPPPDACLVTHFANLDRERNRFAGRVRDLALEMVARLPERILEAVRAEAESLDLGQIDALFTRAFFEALKLADQSRGLAHQAKSDWEQIRKDVQAKAARLKDIAGAKEARLKKGSETEAKIREVFRGFEIGHLLRQALLVSVTEALAGEPALEARLREGYERVHEALAGFLKRRTLLMTHLTNRRDAYLKRRELYLYVFNQVFRERVLDAEIQKKLTEVEQAAPQDHLLKILTGFFFKRWFADPELSCEEVEKALTEAIHLEAQKQIEEAARSIEVNDQDVLRILQEVASDQVRSIFDMKYREHPQAAYRQAMFLYHRDDKATAQKPLEGLDLTDVAQVQDLPFQVLQVTEIYNLPFRALRQFESMDRRPSE